MGFGPMGTNGLEQSREADLGAYLGGLASLYLSATTSDVPEGQIERFGGVMALAAKDAPDIRTSTVLGAINWPRSPHDKYEAALSRWREHSRQIRALAQAKHLPPQLAAQEYVNDRAFSGLRVQSLAVAEAMMDESDIGLNEPRRPRWMRSVVQQQELWELGSRVMYGNWLGALTAGVNQMRGVDMGRSLAAGQVAGGLGNILESMAPGHYSPEPARGWGNPYDVGKNIFDKEGKIRPEMLEDVQKHIAEHLPPRPSPPTPPSPPSPPSGRPTAEMRGTAQGRPRAREWEGVPLHFTQVSEREWVDASAFPDLASRPGAETRGPSGRTSPAASEPRGRAPGESGSWQQVDVLRAIDHEGKLSLDQGTVLGLADLYSRLSPSTRLDLRRSALMELTEVMRAIEDPTVLRIATAKPPDGKREPNLLITRSVAGVQTHEIVEITSITSSAATPARGGSRASSAQEGGGHEISAAILAHTAPTPMRSSQVLVGRRLVVNVMQKEFNERRFAALAQAEVQRIAGELRARPWAQAIDVVGVSERKGPTRGGMGTVSFRRQPDGSLRMIEGMGAGRPGRKGGPAGTGPDGAIPGMEPVGTSAAGRAGPPGSTSRQFVVRGIPFTMTIGAKARAAFDAIPVGDTVVYTVENASGKVLYVGISTKTEARTGVDRLVEHLTTKEGEFVAEAAKLRYRGHYESEREAHALEQSLIDELNPPSRYNRDRTPWQTYLKGHPKARLNTRRPQPEYETNVPKTNTNIEWTIDFAQRSPRQ